MSLLQARNISYQFDNGDTLFDKLSCNLTASRVGLIGQNGAGKSILAAVLMKRIAPKTGEVTLTAKAKYFAQLASVSVVEQLSLAQFLAVDDILNALQQVQAGHCQQRWFDIIGEHWQLPQSLSEQLQAIGLPDDFNQPCHTLSGGQLARLKLWKLFQSDAELLILDEPSNHLDQPAKQWLIKQMKEFSGHILLISHDRLLLEEMQQIWLLNDLGLHQYGGNYCYYLRQQQAEQLALERKLQNLKQQQKSLALQAQKNREKAQQRATKGLQSRKRNDQPKLALNTMRNRATAAASTRSKNQQGRLDFLTQKTEALLQRHQQSKPQTMHFDQANQSSGSFAKAVNAILPFGTTEAINFSIRKHSKVHLNGCNGSGKSTLFKVMMGDTQLKQGCIRINQPVCYLDQHFSLLDNSVSMLENLTKLCPTVTETNACTLLAGIGFRGNRVQSQVAQLSGGEKCKLAILCVTHQPTTPLLLLDEPDNHLDLTAKINLATALNNYQGALMLVSHDLAFVSECDFTEVLTI